MLSKTFATLAAASMLTLGGAASAQSSAPSGFAQAPSAGRAGAALGDDSALEDRGPGFYIIGAIVLGLVIWGIIELTSDNDDDFPTSP